jgi:hypothetical protein
MFSGSVVHHVTDSSEEIMYAVMCVGKVRILYEKRKHRPAFWRYEVFVK